MFDTVANIVSAINFHRDCPPSLLQSLTASHPDREVWLQSYYKEKNGIESLGTFKCLTLGEYQALHKKATPKAILTICILSIRKDEHLMPLQAKSWIVVLGNCESREWSKRDRFTPVLCFDSLRYFVSLAVQRCCGLKQGNCKNAFCQGILPLEEITIVWPPSGDPDAVIDKYWLLQKTLYRLGRSPRHWYELTQFCAPLVLRQMHTTLACTPGLCGTLVTLLHPIWMFLCLWVSTSMTLSTSWRILLLRCCSNIYYGKR